MLLLSVETRGQTIDVEDQMNAVVPLTVEMIDYVKATQEDMRRELEAG